MHQVAQTHQYVFASNSVPKDGELLLTDLQPVKVESNVCSVLKNYYYYFEFKGGGKIFCVIHLIAAVLAL